MNCHFDKCRFFIISHHSVGIGHTTFKWANHTINLRLLSDWYP